MPDATENDESESHQLKASSAISDTPAGIVAEAREEHWKNAPFSMASTVEGMEIDVIPAQDWNAEGPIFLTGRPPSVDGIVTAPRVEAGIARSDQMSPSSETGRPTTAPPFSM